MNQYLVHSFFTVYNQQIKEVIMEKLAIGLSLLAILYVSFLFISDYILKFRQRLRTVKLPGLFKKLNLNRILDHDFSNNEGSWDSTA